MRALSAAALGVESGSVNRRPEENLSMACSRMRAPVKNTMRPINPFDVLPRGKEGACGSNRSLKLAIAGLSFSSILILSAGGCVSKYELAEMATATSVHTFKCMLDADFCGLVDMQDTCSTSEARLRFFDEVRKASEDSHDIEQLFREGVAREFSRFESQNGRRPYYQLDKEWIALSGRTLALQILHDKVEPRLKITGDYRAECIEVLIFRTEGHFVSVFEQLFPVIVPRYPPSNIPG